MSVVMPVHDDQETLPAAVADVVAALDEVALEWELVVVDDASEDASPHLLRELAERDRRIRVLTQPVAMGIGVALRRGFGAARHLVVCTCDASGRYDLRGLPGWFESLRSAALVAGYRDGDGAGGSRAMRWLTVRLVGLALTDPTCAVRLLRLSAAQLVSAESAGPTAFVELVLHARRLGLRWSERSVAVRPAATRGRRREPGVVAGTRELWRLRGQR